MSKIYTIVLLFLVGLVVSEPFIGNLQAQNPYQNGDVIPDGTSVNSLWSIAAGTIVNAQGSFISGADGKISGNFYVAKDYTNSGWSGDKVESGAVLEIQGNLESNQQIIVEDGGTLIVHGDFINTGGGSTNLAGNVVVLGNIDFKNASVSVSGNLVVGGNVTVQGGGGSYTGSIYVLNPTAISNIPDYLKPANGIGDLEDFIANEAGNDELNDLVVEVGLVAPQVTYYTLTSGDWDVKETWTLDPAGAISVDAEVPSKGDNVVILDGKTITVDDAKTLDLSSVTIKGQLDLGKSSGHKFATLRGDGRLLMSKDNYPTIVDESDFINHGGGTVVLYGSSNFGLESRSFCNLEINIDANKSVNIYKKDEATIVNLNGSLIVKNGRFRFGSNKKTENCTLNVDKDITIYTGGQLTASTGTGEYHLNVNGSITNNGKIELTNLDQPIYNDFTTDVNKKGIVVLTMQGESNVNLVCNGITNLYQLIIDKGNSQTYEVNLSASSEENFRLYGRNNEAGDDTKALYLKNGTLKLSGAIFIPTLTEGGSDFVIPSSAQLWLNGAGVKVITTALSDAATNVGGVTGKGVSTDTTGAKSFSLKGKFRVTNGTFNTNTHGFVVWDDGNASVMIEGGTVLTPGFRSAGGNTGKWSYYQSGGLVQLYGDKHSDLGGSGSPTFHVKGSDNVFIMSGGTMEFFDAATNGNLAIGIESGESNYNVTGGTIKINRNNDGGDLFYVSSTAPFYNLEVSGTSNTTMNLTSDLTVLNNVTIDANTTLNASGKTLSIGGDFTNQGTYSTGTNTTKFIGTNPSTVNGGTINFSSVEINKNDKSQLVTLGTGTLSIASDLSITKGTLDVGTIDRNLGGNIDITYGDITGDGALVLNGGAQQTLKGKIGQNPVFGNIKLNNTGSAPQIKLLSDVDVKYVAFQRDQIFDLDIYNLDVATGSYTSANWGNSRMFRTTGLSSDGGLTLPIVLNGNLLDRSVQFFPVGIYDSGNRYTPGEVFGNGTSLNATGSITIVPVNGEHPTTDANASVLPYYWSVTYKGLAGIIKDNIKYNLTYDQNLKRKFEKYGSVLTGSTWKAFSGVRTNNDLTFKFPYAAELSKDFTLGRADDYNGVVTYYSRQSGDWSIRETWSDVSHTGRIIPRGTSIPTNGDRVIIGNGHRITITKYDDGTKEWQWYNNEWNYGPTYNKITVGELIFEQDTAVSKDKEDFSRLIIYEGNDLNFNKVSGTGVLTQYIDNNMDSRLRGDFGDFVDEKYSWFLYAADKGSNQQVYIPETFNVYPNVTTQQNPSNNNSILTFTNDVLIKGNLNPQGNSILRMNTGDHGDITVLGDLLIGDFWHSKVEFGTSGTARTLTVEGNVDFTASSGTVSTNWRELKVLNNAPNGLIHHLNVGGNIFQGAGIIDLGNLGANDNNVIVTFNGSKSASVSKTTNEITDFYRLVIDKPADKKVYFDDDFTLSGDASQNIKPIQLISGECHLDDADIDISISTGGALFPIPSDATLRVDHDSKVKTSGDKNGIALNGQLVIDNNAQALINGGTGNSILFSSGGVPTIEVANNGVLNIGGQLCRTENNDLGVLKFSQNGGLVTVGTTGAAYSNRGMFEILGVGSSFTQVSGDFVTIEHSNASTSVPSLYFDPSESLNYVKNTGFNFDVSKVSNETFGIFANQKLNDINISGGTASGNGSGNKVVMFEKAEVLDGSLSIGANTEFSTNGFDLSVNGNFTNNGAYSALGNTTYFNGIDEDQLITGATSFANVVKDQGDKELSIAPSTEITIDENLTLKSGQLNTGDNNVNVFGDIENEVITTSTGNSFGIILNGTEIQEIKGAGTYSVLTIYNKKGVVVPTQSGAISITNKLKLQKGVFDIGRNLLILKENAYVDPVSPFSPNNMIQTNLSFTDNGIEKYFPVINSTQTFVYPIGSHGKYTPVTFNITANGNNKGSIRVKAADERHVSIADRSETTFDDTQNVLQYNWTLDSKGIEGFAGDVVMKGVSEDVLVTSPNQKDEYITARILLNSLLWNKYVPEAGKPSDFNVATTELTFKFNGTDDDGIDGDYTAGIEDAIPDHVAAYITVADGLWDNKSIWATYDVDTEAIGVPADNIPEGGPRGSVIYVNNVLTLPSTMEIAYRTKINNSGVVNTVGTFGHRLGDVSGTGTLKLSSGDLPAGVYEQFFSALGGTLEYSGSNAYDVLSELPSVNNLVFSGSNEKRLPNGDFEVLGDLTINGSDVVNVHNRNISVKGNITITSGSFDAGSAVGDKVPTLLLNGDGVQNITGTKDFSSASGGAFYNFEVDKSTSNMANILMNVEVSNKLVLTNGVINTSDGGSLTVTNPIQEAVFGGSSLSYVDGPLRKAISNGDNFTFPLGDAARFGQITITSDATSGGIWEAEYYNDNPGNNNLPKMDPNILDGDLKYVSHNEFWRVKAPKANSKATLGLFWDKNSGITPDASFRVVKWTNLSSAAWQGVSVNLPEGNASGGKVSTASSLNFNEFTNGNYITFGSIIIPAYTWVGSESSDWFAPANWSESLVPDASSNVTVEVGSPNNAEINGVAQTNNLIINTGSLIVKSGSNVTINGDLTGIDNGLIVENSNANPSSLIVYGTASPQVNIKWALDKLTYWYIGHSVTGVTMSEYNASFATPNNYFLYEFATPVWSDITKSGTYLFDDPLKGYQLIVKDAGSVLSYSGLLNLGDYTKSGMAAQWYLIANPYSSYLDLEDANFDRGNFLETTWIRTDLGSGQRGFSTFNSSVSVGQNGGDRYVAPGQSMWMRTYTANDAITVPASARVHATGGLKANSIENNVLRMTLQSDYAKDEVVVVARDFGLETMSAYDSEKRLASGKVANFYSLKDGEKAAINTLPTINQQRVVPLGYQVSKDGMSDFTLKVNNLDYFVPEVSVYLKDTYLDKTINLREQQKYTFTPETTQSDDRFELVFDVEQVSDSGVSTDISNPDISESGIDIFAVDQVGYVQFEDEVIQTNGLAELYDTSGVLIKQVQINKSLTEISLPKANSVYIVKVVMGSVHYTKKIESL